MEETPNKPGNSNFKQQRLKGWRLAPNTLILSIIYASIGIFFIIFGLVILLETGKVVEITKRYDNIDKCKGNWKNPKKCTIQIHIHEHMDKPVFFYYEIHNMYQNHRKYNKSRDIYQLMGDHRSKEEVESYCEPIITMDDLGLYTNSSLEGSDVANPCGLVARSVFNDTFSLYFSEEGTEIELEEDEIAWPVDKDEKFDKDSDWRKKEWIDVENEHFMVWMSTAGLPTFRKLWAKIDRDLDEGYYIFTIENNYDVSAFDGEKHIVLSTTSAFGGKIEFMGVLYLIVGGISLVGAVMMFCTYFFRAKNN